MLIRRSHSPLQAALIAGILRRRSANSTRRLIRRCKRRSLRDALHAAGDRGVAASFAATSGAHCGYDDAIILLSPSVVSFAVKNGAHCGSHVPDQSSYRSSVSFAVKNGAYCGGYMVTCTEVAKIVSFAATSGAHCGYKQTGAVVVVVRLIRRDQRRSLRLRPVAQRHRCRESHSLPQAALIAGPVGASAKCWKSCLIRRHSGAHCGITTVGSCDVQPVRPIRRCKRRSLRERDPRHLHRRPDVSFAAASGAHCGKGVFTGGDAPAPGLIRRCKQRSSRTLAFNHAILQIEVLFAATSGAHCSPAKKSPTRI